MRILYAVQGTGNGHITRAIELIPHLQKWGEVDILLSGIQSDIDLPFKVKYKYNGLSFIFGKKGGVDIWRTYWKMKSLKLWKEIKSLPVEKYDLIISDFEPVSSWAAFKAGKSCIGLSNQVATLHPKAPNPLIRDPLGKLVLSNYAPVTYEYGFHFKSLDANIFTPVIRKEVREIKISNEGHYTVYLPSCSDEKIIKNLRRFEAINWHVYSKHSRKNYRVKNISFFRLDKGDFLKSMASCEGVLCNAGFGTTSEALFLKKKLLVVPMKNQYEQHCNTAMLNEIGVSSIKKLNKKNQKKLEDWIFNGGAVEVDYPDNAAQIIETIVKNHTGNKDSHPVKIQYAKLFRNL